jgi:hypothetical protein
MSNKFTGPLFIVGLSRSGTKLIRDLINRNDYVNVPDEETKFIPHVLNHFDLIDDINKYISNSQFVKKKNLIQYPSLEQLNKVLEVRSKTDLIESILKYYAAGGDTKWDKEVIWGDKTPLYLRSLDILKKYFPESKVIHIIRDPRDRAISVKKTWGKSMYRATEKWRNELETLQGWGFDSAFLHEIKYEDLLNDTEKELNTICEFLGIPFQKKMLELSKPSEKHGENSKKLTVNNQNKQKFLNSSRSAIKRIEEIAYPMMLKYNYKPVYATKFKKLPFYIDEITKYGDYIKFRINNKLKGY